MNEVNGAPERRESGHDVLRLLYQAAGSPSYDRLVAAAELKGIEIAKGTISNLLRAKIVTPRRRTVLAFVKVCLGHDQRSPRSPLLLELSPETVSVAYWMKRWDATADVAEEDFFIVCRPSDTPVAQRLTELLRPHARVSGRVALPPDTPREVFERHQRASAATVVLISRPDLGELRSSVEVASELARRDPDSHIVIPVLLAAGTDLPSQLDTAHAIIEGTLPVVVERLLTVLASRRPTREAGPVELASTTAGLLTGIDDHLRGRPSPHGSTVDALLAEFGDPAFSERVRRNGL
jgi:hypothetical protein